MNVKTWIPLVLAIVFAVVAAKAARDWMLKNKAAVTSTGTFATVVIANDDIQPGKALRAEDFTTAEVEADKVPAGSFDDPQKLGGRVNEAFVVKNQPIVESMLAPTGAGSGLQAVIPNGMRAITMEVNEFSGVAGLLTPGCRVDILATINSGDNGQVSKAIVQNVKVTAVGQRMSAAGDVPPPPGEMFKSVTVLATLNDAEAIELACATGRPRLVLRGGRDNTIVATAGVSISELRAGAGNSTTPMVAIAPPPTPTTAPAIEDPVETIARREPPRRVVRVIRGGNESTVTMDLLEGMPDNHFGGTDTSDPFSR